MAIDAADVAAKVHIIGYKFGGTTRATVLQPTGKPTQGAGTCRSDRHSDVASVNREGGVGHAAA